MKGIEPIRIYQRKWFEKIQPYLLRSNLNVGSGHGFFSQAAQEAKISIISLDVAVPHGVVNQKDLVLYDGKTIPFQDDAFEASVAMYVLHHTPNPESLLKEMKRVSEKRVILVEELYQTFIGKVQLAYLDFSVNFKSGLKSKIYWRSYLNHDRLLHAVEKDGWKLVHVESTARKGFDEILWIIDKS